VAPDIEARLVPPADLAAHAEAALREDPAAAHRKQWHELAWYYVDRHTVETRLAVHDLTRRRTLAKRLAAAVQALAEANP
jgi:hypothetical protein